MEGRLSDDAFYRAVACGASPGDACTKPFLRWPTDTREDLTVGLASVVATLPPYRRRLYEAGLTDAVAEINGLGAGLTLRRTDRDPQIAIHVVAAAPGTVMRNTGVESLDGERLALGRVALWATDGAITRAVIAISAKARRREIRHILLEELTQSMGLMTDVAGAAYHRSIFAELGNSVVRLQGQDAMALRRHYGGDAQDDGPDDDAQDDRDS